MDKIAVLDFGGQYAHLIANRIRRLGVYSEIFDGAVEAEALHGYKALILSGGPASLTDPRSVKCDPKIFELGLPILGICYGHQLISYVLGGEVGKGTVKEYGHAKVQFSDLDGIFEGLHKEESVWASHFDQVLKAPAGFKVTAVTKDCPITAMADEERKVYGLQFHPEVTHTACGMRILENFIKISGAEKSWNIDGYIEKITSEIREQVGDKRVFLMISGGVDSTVAFLLLEKALGRDRVYGLLVDTGFMRLGEVAMVTEALKEVGVDNLHVHDASEAYFKALAGVTDPEEKRKIIGELFLDVQAQVSEDLNLNPDEWLLGQGTIYPDTIETGGTKHADKIKTHHNRVDRVQKLIEEGRVIEPIADLYKDEVRMVGEKLGLKASMVWRHPFPGPGLAVRVLCAKNEVYPENVEELEAKIQAVVDADGLKAKVLPLRSVGVQGDERTYANPVLLHGKHTSWDDLHRLAVSLINQFSGVNRVIYSEEFCENIDFPEGDLWLTEERVLTIQKADKVVMDCIADLDLMASIWQFPTVLIPVTLDSRHESIVLRPVESTEAMTANFYRMSKENLDELKRRLKALGVVSGIFYDVTDKPPGTIEWE